MSGLFQRNDRRSATPPGGPDATPAQADADPSATAHPNPVTSGEPNSGDDRPAPAESLTSGDPMDAGDRPAAQPLTSGDPMSGSEQHPAPGEASPPADPSLAAADEPTAVHEPAAEQP